jgi:hypothetical protein
MITGIHAVIFTTDAEQDRAFFRDVVLLDLRKVAHRLETRTSPDCAPAFATRS